MEVLSSRVLLRPSDPARSRRFYRDVLGLAVYREFGDPADPSLVFFLGGGFLELSAAAGDAPEHVALWWQVRDVDAEHQRLAGLGVTVLRPPRTEPWGLREMWLRDPDGVRIVLVEVPEQHPLRRDGRAMAEPEPADSSPLRHGLDDTGR
jgi:catechol 2,3-dioxygenase-like lactoylglutathione lyase family enzyme